MQKTDFIKSPDISELYQAGLVSSVAKSGTVIFSDIDNTFICHEGHNKPLTDKSYQLASIMEQLQFGVVLVTGAPWSKAVNSSGGTPGVVERLSPMEEDLAIIPSNVHAIFTDGGLHAYVRDQNGKFYQDTDYEQFVHSAKQAFNIQAATSAANEFIRRVNNESLDIDLSVFNHVEILPEPVAQVAVFQHAVKPYEIKREDKISMFFHAEDSEQLSTISKIAKKHADLCQAKCIICEEKDINNRLMQHYSGEPPVKRYNLDFTCISKSSPIDYIILERLDALKVQNCIVAGDAGNDAAMFNSKHVNMGVIVGGAAPELTRLAKDFFNSGKEIFNEQNALRKGPESLLAAIDQYFTADPFKQLSGPNY